MTAGIEVETKDIDSGDFFSLQGCNVTIVLPKTHVQGGPVFQVFQVQKYREVPQWLSTAETETTEMPR